MKICWDTLNNLVLTKRGKFRKGNIIYVERTACSVCGDAYLTRNSNPSIFCGKSCSKSGNHNPMYGKKPSKMSNMLRSISLKGISRPKHVCDKISRSNTGKKRNVEAKTNMSVSARNRVVNYWTGRKRSANTKDKISRSLSGRFSGPNNPMYGRRGHMSPSWRGGVSSHMYCVVWRYNSWREIIYNRDSDKFCWNPQCSGNGTKETLHHINYNKKDCSLNNIIKICNSCNSTANFNRSWWQSFYTALMYRRGL